MRSFVIAGCSLVYGWSTRHRRTPVASVSVCRCAAGAARAVVESYADRRGGVASAEPRKKGVAITRHAPASQRPM